MVVAVPVVSPLAFEAASLLFRFGTRVMRRDAKGSMISQSKGTVDEKKITGWA